MRDLAIAAQTVLDAGPVGLVRAAAAAGFAYVGPRVEPVQPSDPRIIGTPLEDELVAALRETGVRVMESGVFPLIPDMDWDALARGVDFSARIGARFLGCPCDDPDFGRARDSLSRLCDVASPSGLVVLIEFSPRRACGNLALANDLVLAAGKSNVGLLVDALHLSRSGGHPRDLAAIDPALLRLVHLCDASAFHPGPKSFEQMRAEANAERLYPGEGELWLDEFIAALPPHCAISVEAPSSRHKHLPAAERARLALDATRALLARA